MHYFQFNIKSYQAATAHLTNAEDLAYRRLLELYYDTEQPIKASANPLLCRRLRVGLEELESVLSEFFVLTDSGWSNAYCDGVIAEYKAYLDRQKANGSKGGRGHKADAKPNKPTALPDKPSAKPTINNKPETINQSLEKGRATRLPKEFNPEIEIEAESGIDRRLELLKFRDYWSAMPGQKGCKLDWQATWRNWARNAKRNENSFGKSQITIPAKQGTDPEILRVIQAGLKATPMPASVREYIGKRAG